MVKNIVNLVLKTVIMITITINSIGIYEMPLTIVSKQDRSLADVIVASDLDYTILHPDYFTNANKVN